MPDETLPPAEEVVKEHPLYGLVPTEKLIASINFARTLPNPDEDLDYTGENGDGQDEQIPPEIAG